MKERGERVLCLIGRVVFYQIDRTVHLSNQRCQKMACCKESLW